MNNYNLSAKDLMYLGIKQNKDFLYGFDDPFISFEKKNILEEFDKIAETLEQKKLIYRNFDGTIKTDEKLDTILNVIFEPSCFIDYKIIIDKLIIYRFLIYKRDQSIVVIETDINQYNLTVKELQDEEYRKIIDEKISLKEKKILDGKTIKYPADKIDSLVNFKIEDIEKILKEYDTDEKYLIQISKLLNNNKSIHSVLSTDVYANKTNSYQIIELEESNILFELVFDSDKYIYEIKDYENKISNLF